MRDFNMRIRLFIGLLAVLLTGTLASSSTAQTNDGPLKVFILAGQSNMQGHAKISTFDYLGDDEKTLPMLREMQGSDGQPRTIQDTWISYLTEGPSNSNGEGTGLLTAGYGARNDATQASDKIGPEFTFGIYMQKSLRQPILIIKTAWGGKSLHTDFRPPSAGQYEFNESEIQSMERRGLNLKEERAKKKAQCGVYYHYMIDHVNRVLQDIKRVYPDYVEAQGFELAGFVWFQGWNDVVNGNVYPDRGKPGGYDKYSEWMAMLIRDVRKDLQAPQMPFVIGVLGVDGPIENIAERYQNTNQSFRAAMAAPASLPEFDGTVLAVPTAPYWDMPLANIQKKREQLNQRQRRLQQQVEKEEPTANEAAKELAEIEAELTTPEFTQVWNRGASNAAYHYFGCAKTMAQIGKAFADATLTLQKK